MILNRGIQLRALLLPLLVALGALQLSQVAHTQEVNPPTNNAPDAATPDAATPDAATPDAAVQAPTEIQWVKSLDEVNERATKENKLILAYFYAPWCGYCKQFDKTIVYDPSVVLLSDEYVSTRVNGDNEPEMVKQYGVNGYPGLVLADADGKEVKKIIGLTSPGAYSQLLGQQLAKHSLSSFEEQAKRTPNDLRLLAKIATIHAYNSNLEKAEAIYNWVVHEDPEDKLGYHFPMQRAMAPLYLRSKQYEKMVAHLEPQFRFLQHTFEITQASMLLGMAYRNLKQWDKVIAPMEYVLAASAKDAPAQQKAQAQQALQEARQHLTQQ